MLERWYTDCEMLLMNLPFNSCSCLSGKIGKYVNFNKLQFVLSFFNRHSLEFFRSGRHAPWLSMVTRNSLRFHKLSCGLVYILASHPNIYWSGLHCRVLWCTSPGMNPSKWWTGLFLSVIRSTAFGRIANCTILKRHLSMPYWHV